MCSKMYRRSAKVEFELSATHEQYATHAQTNKNFNTNTQVFDFQQAD